MQSHKRMAPSAGYKKTYRTITGMKAKCWYSHSKYLFPSIISDQPTLQPELVIREKAFPTPINRGNFWMLLAFTNAVYMHSHGNVFQLHIHSSGQHTHSFAYKDQHFLKSQAISGENAVVKPAWSWRPPSAIWPMLSASWAPRQRSSARWQHASQSPADMERKKEGKKSGRRKERRKEERKVE